MIENGSFEMRDIAGPTTAGLGAGLTLTPSLILQVIGCVVAVFGLFYAHKRFNESKRANDIAQDRLNWDKQRHASNKKAQTKSQAKE